MVDKWIKTNDKELLLKMYEVHSHNSQNYSNLKEVVNAFFIGVNSFLFDKIISSSDNLPIYLIIIGFIITILWYHVNKYMYTLNKIKVENLIEMEKQIGVLFYAYEWKKIKKQFNNKAIFTLAKAIKYLISFLLLIYVFLFIICCVKYNDDLRLIINQIINRFYQIS